MTKKFLFVFSSVLLIFVLFGISVFGETLFYEGTFNANGNCAYYGSFPSDLSAVYMSVNGEDPIGLLFNADRTELTLQSGTVVFRFTNNYWITTRTYACWSELGINPVTITLATNTLSFSSGNDKYTESVSPLVQWAFGDEFILYSASELEGVLTGVNIFEFATLIFTPRIFLSVLFYSGLSLMCALVIGFIPLLFLFVWKFLISAFLGKKRWFK